MDPKLFVRYWASETECVDLPPHPAAKQACSVCPVRDECLEWAVGIGQEGYAGGMTKVERDNLEASREQE